MLLANCVRDESGREENDNFQETAVNSEHICIIYLTTKETHQSFIGAIMEIRIKK